MKDQHIYKSSNTFKDLFNEKEEEDDFEDEDKIENIPT